jgi:hypothetical protein
MMGNPLMNDASLSQTAGRAKTRQPGLIVEPPQIVLSSYNFSSKKVIFLCLAGSVKYSRSDQKVEQASLNIPG